MRPFLVIVSFRAERGIGSRRRRCPKQSRSRSLTTSLRFGFGMTRRKKRLSAVHYCKKTTVLVETSLAPGGGLAQFEALDLAGRRFGKLADKLDPLRALVRSQPGGNVLADDFAQFG